MPHLTDEQRLKLKNEGAQKYRTGQTTIRALAQEYNCSVPTVMWHLGYRAPNKRRKYIRPPVGPLARPASVVSFIEGGVKDKASVEASKMKFKQAAQKAEEVIRQATVIVGTTDQIVDILIKLNQK